MGTAGEGCSLGGRNLSRLDPEWAGETESIPLPVSHGVVPRSCPWGGRRGA